MQSLDLSGPNPGDIGRLMKLLASTDVEECEIQQGDFSISLKRSALPAESGPLPEAVGVPEAEEQLFVPSPAVGVFHRSEGRSDPPSIDVGTSVKTGEVLGVIEVMGVPHPVHSTRDGVIGEFLVEDGEPVEYGQPIVSYQSSAISHQSQS